MRTRACTYDTRTFQWPSHLEWTPIDRETIEVRCVMLPRLMSEQFRDVDVPKRPIVDARALAFRFLARGQS